MNPLSTWWLDCIICLENNHENVFYICIVVIIILTIKCIIINKNIKPSRKTEPDVLKSIAEERRK